MDISGFLRALPAAAANPLALMAYLGAVGAWFLLGWRTRRLRVVLKNIKYLPAGDRLTAVKAELGHVNLREGISPEQWLRSRIHFFVFLGFVIVCAVFVLVTAMTLTAEFGSVAGTIDLYK